MDKKKEVIIDITKKTYEFIDGATGEKISAEEFAKRYPAVGLGRPVMGNGEEKTNKESAGADK